MRDRVEKEYRGSVAMRHSQSKNFTYSQLWTARNYQPLGAKYPSRTRTV